MVQPEIRIDARKPGIIAGQDNHIEALIRIRVPALPETAVPSRPALNLAFVIDRSGSMSGHPLREACQSTMEMLKRLAPRDRAAIIVYDDKADTLVPSRPVDDVGFFQRALRMITSGGSTNLHGGWEQGCRAIESQVSKETISRVLLLSDGRANTGIDDPRKIAVAVAERAEAGISTSTYGLGRDFNEDLMIDMGRRGGGRSAYGETAVDLIEPYREEFALLDATFGRQVRLRLKSAGGGTIEVVNGYERGPDGAIMLPELAHGAETWALVRFVVPASAFAQAKEGAMFAVLEAEISFEGNDGRRQELPATWLALPVIDAQAWADLQDDALVARRAGELHAARFQDAAIDAVERGDFVRVFKILAEARLEAKGNPWIEAILSSLEELAAMGDGVMLVKELKFSRYQLRNRLASHDELALYSPLAESKEAAFLRRKMRRGRKEF